MRTFSLLSAIAAALPLATAHFTLDYPTTRGFDEDLEPNFCGGFPNPSSSRTPFPLSGAGPILIDSHHASAIVGVLISFDQNATSFADFNQTSSGQGYGFLSPLGSITGTGEFCFNVDVASLGLSNITNGTQATIQVEFNGGDGVLLQCSDVVLVSDYTVPSNVSCTNGTASASSTSSGTPSATGSTGAAGASASGKTSGASKTVVGSLVAAAAALVGAVAML